MVNFKFSISIPSDVGISSSNFGSDSSDELQDIADNVDTESVLESSLKVLIGPEHVVL